MKVAGSENTLQSAAKAKNVKLAFFSDLAEKSQNMKKAIKGLKEMLDMIFNLFFILVLIHFFRCLKRNELHYQACFFLRLLVFGKYMSNLGITFSENYRKLDGGHSKF